MIPFIDLSQQHQLIKSNLQKRFDILFNHTQFIMGPEIAEMEEVLSEFIGSKHCISVASGTDALLITLMALGIKAGDEIIIPDFSFFGTSEVISLLGAKPIFVDVDTKSCNLDSKLIEKHITEKTKVIMPVSLYGQCADFDQINAIAKKHNITVVEDGAQSFGAEYKGKKSLNLTSIGCTSFFPSKPLGCYGDGGAIFTNDGEIAQALREIRVHGSKVRYNHTRIGVNARMDTMQAAVILEKMTLFENEMERRQEIAHAYDVGLKNSVEIPLISEENLCAYAQYTIRHSSRDELRKKLQDQGIPTAVHYPKPISKQPYYLETYGENVNNPISSTLAETVLSLPFGPYLNKKDQEFIINTLKKLA